MNTKLHQLTSPLALGLAAFVTLAAGEDVRAEFNKMTHTYKKVGDLEIKADVHRDESDRKRPVVVWIHGGALIMGHRESVPGWLMAACKKSDYVLVSIDYRLAPETQLPEIIADVEDSLRWIRQKGPELFDADPKRIAVVGGSAGGYLTLATGHRVQPRPTALVPLWGYGDLVGSWYSQPSPHPRHHTSKLSREEAFAALLHTYCNRYFHAVTCRYGHCATVLTASVRHADAASI